MKRPILPILFVALIVSACSTASPAPPSPETTATQPALAEKPILQIDSGGHMAVIRDIFFTQDGNTLISASDDKTVRLWDIASGKTTRILRGQIGLGNEGKIFAATLSPDNRWLALGGWFNEDVIRLIDLPSGKVLRLLKGHTNVISDLAFSANGRFLLSGSGDTTARIWDVASGESLHTLTDHQNDIYAVAFSSDGRKVVTGSGDHTLKLWDRATGKLLSDMTEHTDKVKSVAFTPDGRYLLSGSRDQTILLWQGIDGKFIKVLAQQDSGVTSLSISPDGTKVVTGIGEGPGSSNNVFSIPAGERLTQFSGHKNIVLATAISPDGATAATGGGDDHGIYLWDLQTGQIKQRLVGNGNQIWSVGFAQDGRSIAWGSIPQKENERITALELSFQLKDQQGHFSLTLGGDNSSATFAPASSQYLRALGSVGDLSIGTPNNQIDPNLLIRRNNQIIHTITRNSANGYVHRSLTLTPDGQTVISGGSNGNLSSYNPISGQKIHDFVGHTSDVWAVAASPDNRLLVSGSADQTVKLWEIASGKLLLTIFHGSDGEWVAWTEDGFYTASVKGDAYVGYHINRGADRPADYVGLDQIGQHFYRPDLVAKTLQGGFEREIEQELARIGSIDQIIANGLPPEVRLLSASGETSQQRNFTLQVAVKALNGGIGTVRYFVNGAEIASTGARSEAPSALRRSGVIKDNEQYAEKPLTLPDGDNTLTVIACNKNNTICSRGTQLTRSVQDPQSKQPSLHILAVGISSYRDRDLNLKFAANDAETLSKRLQQQAQGLYRTVHTPVTLVNENATIEKIEKAFADIAKRVEPNDVFVLFMAGHGMAWQGDYHFIPWDAVYENSESLIRASLSQQKLADLLKRIPTAKSLIVLDSCSAGQFATGLAEGKQLAMLTRGNISDKSAIDRLMRATGRYVLAATTERGYALEGHDQHGVFTWALLEGLKGHASLSGSSEGSISLDDLANYVRAEVPKITQQKWGFEQIPMRLIQGDSFPIACKAGYDKPGCNK